MGAMFFKSGKDKFSNLEKTFSKDIKDISVKDIEGNDKKVGDYFTDKKAIIFVNTASECGLTKKNYGELVELYEKYNKDGLEILGFPCNQFMGQESKCEFDIKNFANKNFKVTFPLFSKIEVNGAGTHELFKYLKFHSKDFKVDDGTLANIPWNFAKFLVDSNGKVIQYYAPKTDPSTMVPEIEKLLH
jgi:glutathione peroxidase